MPTDPAAAAWRAAGSPRIEVAAPGRCGRCGDDGPTTASSRIISNRFTDFDTWPYGSRRLCAACAWAYSRRPTAQPTMLITTDEVTEYPAAASIAELLAAGALSDTTSAVVPTTRRRHILPTAQWAHLATDGLVVRWDDAAAKRLRSIRMLRLDLGFTWQQLSNPAPPAKALTAQPPSTWPQLLASWSSVQPWRRIPPLWACARLLTAPAASDTPATATPRRGDDQSLL
ncbi:hypothetical protein Mycsm_07115 (plasmid) [Mycobacterium sp. JS623]|uniref:hypothetical protein n=1 Tax=Mycobacterium sp. JS623 TaxID=212767 RepID=UPI0002A5AB4D|nr:hypothetical protein [Mycobacterium sp. JS623]AGB27212.1 hypothetical protein Mycsm_07115 [Mycobacterium sp. JS623]